MNRIKKQTVSNIESEEATVYFITSIDIGDVIAYTSATLKLMGYTVTVFDDTECAYAQKYLSSFSQVGQKKWEYRGINVHSSISDLSKIDGIKIVLTDRYLDVINADSIVYITTDMDVTSIAQTCEVIDAVSENEMKFDLVTMNYEDCKIDTKVMELLFSQFSNACIENDHSIYFDNVAHARKIENQYNDHIAFRGISKEFKHFLRDIIVKMIKKSESEIDKYLNLAGKGL